MNQTGSGSQTLHIGPGPGFFHSKPIRLWASRHMTIGISSKQPRPSGCHCHLTVWSDQNASTEILQNRSKPPSLLQCAVQGQIDGPAQPAGRTETPLATSTAEHGGPPTPRGARGGQRRQVKFLEGREVEGQGGPGRVREGGEGGRSRI